MNEQKITKICQALGYDYATLVVPNRKRERVETRFLIFKYLRDVKKMTLSEIGRYFNKDHTSIIHGIDMINHWMRHDSDLSERYKILLTIDTPAPFTSMGKNLKQ